MLKIIIITVLIYSLILTVTNLYKDSSGYYIIGILDIITAGPVCWLLVLICFSLKPIFKKNSHKKDRKLSANTYKKKSEKYIEKVVNKIIKIYKKRQKYSECFDFTYMHSAETYYDDGINGWADLLFTKEQYEIINRKFENLMFHQKEDTLLYLTRHCRRLTREEIDKFDKYHVINKDRTIYTIDL